MDKSIARPELHQLAALLGIPYARLANAQVAYKPQMGKPYSKDEINWEAVDAFVTRRLDKTEYDTIEALYAAASEVTYTPKARSKDPNSVWHKMLFGTTPMRKGNVKVGDSIRHKKDGIEGTVVFVNDTIVCFDVITEEGAEKLPTSAIGNRVFNNQYVIIGDENAEEPVAEASAE